VPIYQLLIICDDWCHDEEHLKSFPFNHDCRHCDCKMSLDFILCYG